MNLLDKLYFEPNLLVPGRKPTGEVILDSGDGLIGSVLFQDQGAELIIPGGSILPYDTDGAITVNEQGVVWKSTKSTSNRNSYAIPESFKNLSALTIVAGIQPVDDASGSRILLCRRNTGTATWQVTINYQSATTYKLGVAFYSSGWKVYEGTTTYNTNEYHDVSWVFGLDNDVVQFYADGALDRSQASTFSFAEQDLDLYIFDTPKTDAHPVEAYMSYAHFYNKGHINTSFHQKIHSDPYKVYKSKSNIILFPVVTGAPYTLTADKGTYTHTGIAANITAQRNIVAALGTYSLTGIDSTLTAQRKIAAVVGAYALTGNDATLTYTTIAGYEDFTTYTEVDTGSDITVDSSTQISFTSMDADVDGHVYYDKGINYYSGDFTHEIDFNISSSDTSNVTALWMLSNSIDDYEDHFNSDLPSFAVYSTGSTGTDLLIRLSEFTGSGTYVSSSYTATEGTRYYLEIERDETVGTYGTLYCRIYSDLSHTTLLTTLSLTLHVKENFRYIYALNSWNSGLTGRAATGDVQRLISTSIFSLEAGVGSYALTGIAANITAQRNIAANTGVYTLSGIAAALSSGYKLQASTGTYILSGIVASLRAGRQLSALTGTYTLTGNIVAFQAARKLNAALGEYILTGNDAALYQFLVKDYFGLTSIISSRGIGLDGTINEYGKGILSAIEAIYGVDSIVSDRNKGIESLIGNITEGIDGEID